MNNYQILALKSLRRVYLTLFMGKKEAKSECIQEADVASQIIQDALMAEKPCMIARFGSTELACLLNYVGVTHDKNRYLPYIQGKSQRWWWEDAIIKQMQNSAI